MLASYIVTCKDCGLFLGFEPNAPIFACSNCGSVARHVEVTVKDRIEFHESVKLIAKEPNDNRAKYEIKTGDDLHRDSGFYYKIHRVIDRENDRYIEKIMDSDGNTIRDVDEPLSQHINHGSAKRAKPKE